MAGDGAQAPPPQRPGRLTRLGRWIASPITNLWHSESTIDSFALVHMSSVGGDAFVTIALASTIFFSVPVEESTLKVVLYLAITVLPLAFAGPILVPLLDRAGPRRAILVGAAAGRALLALLLATRLDTPALYPLALGILVLTKIHTITKNGLTIAYVEPEEGLVKANARLGRWAVIGATLATIPAGLLSTTLGGEFVMYGAAITYSLSMLLDLRLPQPEIPAREEVTLEKRGRIPELFFSATGAIALRGAVGFLLLLVAFAAVDRVRRGEIPTWQLAMVVGIAAVGGFLADVVAPKLPRFLREEGVVFGSLILAGLTALLAAFEPVLWTIALFALAAGAATEFGRLAFQSLMQRVVPENAHGRVFVRYEAQFQVAWVAGAFLPAVFSITFQTGLYIMGVYYMVVALFFVLAPFVPGGGGEGKRRGPRLIHRPGSSPRRPEPK